jgi:hypothetical protein
VAFVRAKTIKGQKYAYFVQNKWVKGKVKQVTKKYLGKIIFLEPEKDSEEIILDAKKTKKQLILDILRHTFYKYGFIDHTRKNAVLKGSLEVHLSSGSITDTGKNVVLQLNDRYVYPALLLSLLDFYQPEAEDERPGTRLAKVFSDAGIAITPDQFVLLYKKIYT